MAFRKTAILGVGLLGASFSLAIKKKGICNDVTGFGRSRENLGRARNLGILDAFSSDPASACTDADLVLLAAPAGSFVELVKQACPAFKKGAIVIDVGSVKGDLVHELEELMPAGVHFIGSHPIAGSDRSGIDSAQADLFRDALCVVTPTERSDPSALKSVMDLWSSLGSKVMAMGPAQHDRVYAAVSHLPHLVAFAMVNTVSDIDQSYLSYCGQGFRDMTRIAASSPDIWTDIALLNRNNLIEMIALFRENLNRMEAYLRTVQPDALRQEFIRASTARESIGQD
ncbi:MAG: prephenate dehydrogenase/arogenate dehydrogenase family protein [Nitrospirae bacterium]|nr:prephenate dehydrogenase/arogenate dehydrogenase family protein [Nitrospirota bacterium]